jgi:ribonuclease P protein component
VLNANKLGKDSRLTTLESFQRVFKNAEKFSQLGIRVLVCKNELKFSRLGITIPKKQVPRAVDRNRIKRIIRESFRLRRHELFHSVDMVFLVYTTLLSLSNKEIRTCLDLLWAKLIVFCKKA